MSKPIVMFSRGEIVPWAGYRVARLTNVENHPKLGDVEWVRTSIVVDEEYNGDDLVRVETLNTIYEKR